MGWYKQCMPTVKDASVIIANISGNIRNLPGVVGVYVHGSYAKNINQPKYLIKDIDIIAATTFDAGDLLAIDNSKYSALKIAHNELEDEGFNPDAVNFTKQYLGFDIDHWASAKDGKLLHWGAIPDTQSDWEDLHIQAENRAEKDTGVKISNIHRVKEEKRKEWKRSYDTFIAEYLKSNATGWYPSEQNLESIIKDTKKII